MQRRDSLLEANLLKNFNQIPLHTNGDVLHVQLWTQKTQ
jgi:hypothetical protein